MGNELALGNDRLSKGLLANGKAFFAWDAIQECDVARCAAAHRCGYIKAGGKCTVQLTYLKTFFESVVTTYDHMTETELFKVGMHLVPLYSQLCRLKIQELGTTEVVYYNDKGNAAVNPIFKEIRETLKVIHLMWRDLSFCPVAPPDPSLKDKDNGKPKDMYGDPGHVARLEKERGEISRGVIR